MIYDAKSAEFIAGYWMARGIINVTHGGTHYGDTSNVLEKAKSYVKDFDKYDDNFKGGFCAGVYATHVCG